MEEVHAVTPAEPVNGQIVVLKDGDMIGRWQTDAVPVMSSLNLDDDNDAALYLKALGTPDGVASTSTNKEIKCVHWLLHEVELTNPESGECVPALRLVIIGPQGETISTCSEVLVNQWKHVLRVWKTWPANPPVTFQIAAFKAKKIGHYLQFINFKRQTTPAESAGKKAR